MSNKIYKRFAEAESGENDVNIIIPLKSDFYKLAVDYAGFDSAATFSLATYVGDNPLSTAAANFVAVADSEVTIDDASGRVIYSNATEEKADYLVLIYTSNSNDSDSTFIPKLGVRS